MIVDILVYFLNKKNNENRRIQLEKRLSQTIDIIEGYFKQFNPYT
jgi:hypothetical protein